MIIDYEAIGQRIKKIRQQKKITQEQLAELLGVSSVYMNQIENAKTKINLERLVNLANLLDTEPGFLLNGTICKARNYLFPELDLILQECSPEKRRVILAISQLIAEFDIVKDEA
ncbi:MAG: helix-turn-helix transcriptional regulator [Bacillota bacterium]|jgi:transcriptional regulator with XRE-family HTH domain